MQVIEVTKSALKHGLTEEEIRYAWENLLEYRRCRAEKQPPHYLAIGTLPNGNPVELVAFSTGYKWVIFHAMTPLTPGFKKQYKGALR